MFNWYDTIKQYYDRGMYDDVQLQIFVTAGWITDEQAREIAGVLPDGPPEEELTKEPIEKAEK